MSQKTRQGQKILTSLEDLKTALEEPMIGGGFDRDDFVVILQEGLGYGKVGIVRSVGQSSALVGFLDGRFSPRECVVRLEYLAELTPELWRVWKHRNPLKKKRRKRA